MNRPGEPPARILVVDNFDSFVYTIAGYLRELGAQIDMVRNDAIPASFASYQGVLISPGPGTPAQAGGSKDAIRRCLDHELPMLGVCLGHQALAEVLGGQVSHAPQMRHGKTSLISHDGTGVFASLPSPLRATRYHSLAVERAALPGELEISAWTGERASGVIMGLRHRSLPAEGVQFHPESALTEGGHLLLANWLATCGMPGAIGVAAHLRPLIADQ